MRRTINTKKLREVVQKRGEGAVTDIAHATGVSASWFQKAMAGSYKKTPRKITMRAICDEVGMNLDELFPEAATKGRAS